MANGYMPRSDNVALVWMRRFSNGLVERPAVYGVTPQNATEVRDAVDRFAEALRLATALATRTSVTIAFKDQARASAEAACRLLYFRIKPDPSISDADKCLIGIQPLNPSRTRIQAPETAPLLRRGALSWNDYEILCLNAESPSRLAKPRGVAQVQLFRTFASSPTVANAQLFGCFTRYLIKVAYSAEDDGRTATYFARWMTRRGQVGPWSRPLSVRIASSVPYLASQLAA